MTDELREKYLEQYLKRIAKRVIDDTDENFTGLRELARECNAVAYRSRLLTGDVAVFYGNYVALIKRKRDADLFPDCWALPGGHINERESEEAGAIRELREETGIEVEQLRHVGRIQIPDRYPTDLWIHVLEEQQDLTAGDDAQDAMWTDINDIATKKIKLAFNHNKLVRLAFVEYHEIVNA